MSSRALISSSTSGDYLKVVMKKSTGPSLGMHEAMFAYSRGTGLKSIGPHRRLADRLIGELSETCSACEGKQIIRAGKGREWCSACGGFGRRFVSGGRDGLLKRVLADFPDARN